MMDEATRKLVGHKVRPMAEVARAVGPRPRHKQVIMCHGTFDIVHPGHVRHLLYAKSKGDILIASLTADKHVLKANFRPFVPQELRAFNLAALEAVDYVIIDSDPTPIGSIQTIQPDYFAKGYEYTRDGLHPRTAEEKAAVEAYGGEMIFTPGDIIYSSSHLIETAPPAISTEKLMTLLDTERLGFDDLRQALPRFQDLHVHVVGDTIVDTYTRCAMIGSSTKTPMISVRFDEKIDFVGGAGIVAKHLSAAGARVTFSTVLGDDPLAGFVQENLAAAGIECVPITDPTRPTTNKEVITAAGQHLLKVDRVDNRAISDRILEALIDRIRGVRAQVIVFSDFRHGMFNRETIPPLSAAIPEAMFRVADSQVASRWGNILDFQDFDLITPNEREARFALGDQDLVVRQLGAELYRRAHCKTLMLKLGEHGLMAFRGEPDDEEERTFFAVDSFADRVVDALGSGDASLGYAAPAMYLTGNAVIASVLGSLAAAVECEHEGNIPVEPRDVLAKIDRLERLAQYR
jgi:rfaE bifunctional protein kinase chain/domain/rfaE bifunctional protein nucleotidyltransferase chain/domain